MEYIRKIVSVNLKALREERGLKGYEVAEGSGISQASYSRFESGGWIADPEAIEKLALFYNIRSSRLFYDPELNETPVSRPTPSSKEIIKDLQAIIDKLS